MLHTWLNRAGSEKGGYYHPLFKKGNRELTFDIQRIPQNTKGKSIAVARKDDINRGNESPATPIASWPSTSNSPGLAVFPSTSIYPMEITRLNEHLPLLLTSGASLPSKKTLKPTILTKSEGSELPQHYVAFESFAAAKPTNPNAQEYVPPSRTSIYGEQSLLPTGESFLRSDADGLSRLQQSDGFAQAEGGNGPTLHNPTLSQLQLLHFSNAYDSNSSQSWQPTSQVGFIHPGASYPRQENQESQHQQKQHGETISHGSDWFSILEQNFPPQGGQEF